MRKILKVFSLFMILLTLSIVIQPVSVYAGFDGSGDSGIGGGSTETGVGGASTGKTGFLIYTSDKSGHATSPVYFITSYGRTPNANEGSLTTRFGDRVSIKDFSKPVVWNMPPFDGNGNGNGLAIKSWLLSPYKDGNSGAKWICVNYLGMSEDEYDEWSAKEDVFLNVEAVMWAGVFTNSEASSFTGKIFIGNATSWANRVSPSQFIGRYSHRYMPEGMHYDKDFMCLSKANTTQSKHSAAEICSPVGWGIITVKPKESEKMVIVVRMTGTEVDSTSYEGCNDIYAIKNEGNYVVKQWESSTKSYNGSYDSLATYDTVRSEGNSDKHRSGTGTTNFVFESTEKVLYVLMVRDVQPERISTGDKILADELNMIFNTLEDYHGSRVGFRKSPTYFTTVGAFTFNLLSSEPYLDAKRMVEEDVHKRNFSLDPPDSYLVGEEKSGSLVELNGSNLYLKNSRYEVWKGYDEEKRFAVNDTIISTYAYNVSRALWESSLKLSSYRNEAADDLDYAAEYLKLGHADIGTVTEFPNAIDNSTITAGDKSDTFKWDYTGKVNFKYEQELYHMEDTYDSTGQKTGTTEVSDGWEPRTGTLASTPVEITSNHLCDKYRAMSLGTASNPKAGTVAYEFLTRPHSAGRDSLNLNSNTKIGDLTHNKEMRAFATQQGSLNINPVVPMYIYKQTAPTFSSQVAENLTYVMGERMRKCKPATLHGYTVGLDRGSTFEGEVALASAATGTNAQDLFDTFGVETVGVTAQGTTFAYTTSTRYRMDMYTYALDCIDNTSEVGHGSASVRSVWGNDGYMPEASHEAFVQTMDTNTEVQCMLQPYSQNGRPEGDTYELLCDESKRKFSTAEVQNIYIDWRNGEIVNKAEIISALEPISKDPSTTYENWGLEQQLNAMFISNTDADRYNKSKAGELMQEAYGGNWYDEQSLEMVIRIYHTTCIYGQMAGNDKVEYSMKDIKELRQDASRYSKGIGTNGALCRVFARLYFKEPKSITLDGFEFPQVPPTIRVDNISGTEFILANINTSNMRK